MSTFEDDDFDVAGEDGEELDLSGFDDPEPLSLDDDADFADDE